MIRLKSATDIKNLRTGGKILADILQKLVKETVDGAIPLDLDKKAQTLISQAGCLPAFLNYAPDKHTPFPAALCVSVNDAIVHGLPNNTPFVDGDLVGLDLGLIYKNKYFLDSACTVGVGAISTDSKKLLAVTQQALMIGVSTAIIGNRIGDIGFAIQSYVEKQGLEVVKQLVGHGVGFAVHESPQVPNFGKKRTGDLIEEGLVIALEPMVTVGDATVVTGEDGWSVKVKTGNKTAHFEHTIAVTKNGPIIMTVQ